MTDELPIGPTVLAPGPKEPNPMRHRIATWMLLPFTLWLIGIVLVFYVFFTSVAVDGSSMAPTLRGGDRLLVTHGNPLPQRGDIVVTEVEEDGEPVELVKRVIALPGDTVEILSDVAYVNGDPEPTRGQVVDSHFAVSRPRITVPAGHVYVMGDNRPNSEDSRYLGPIPISGIMGKAVFVFAPIYRLRPI
jgi:signal peptidase I